MKFLVCSDIHFSDVNPVSRIDNYLEALLAKMGQIRAAAEKLRIEALIISGDVFHVKAPSRVSHSLTQIVMDCFQKFSCPILCLPGNHDLSDNRLDSLPRQPLGTLFKAGVAINLIEVQPYKLSDQDVCVGIQAVPYSSTPKLEDFKLPRPERIDCEILVAHCFADRNPGNFFGERVFGYEELMTVSTADVFLFGHDHRDHGLTVIGKKHFLSVGAISRGSLDTDNLTRDVKIGYVEIGRQGIISKEYKLSVRPASEVFDLKKKEKEQKDQKVIEDFVSTLAKPIDMDASDMEKILASMQFPREVLEKIKYYLEQAEYQKD